MEKVKVWLSAARLRTLPLSLSGIITGTALANFSGERDGLVFALCLLVTVGFQITSNFANDYGDGIKGTDSADRIGPERALQSGKLTPKELKWGIGITAVLSLLLALVLLIHSFGLKQLQYFLLFALLGILSIWAAIRYTVGDSAYGYKGLGDIFVFLFFGLLAVLGTKFLYTLKLDWIDVLPATAIGLLCVGVLNLNNLRDVESDRKSHKNTLVVKLGFQNGKVYHALLLSLSLLSFLGYIFLQFSNGIHAIFMLPYLVVLVHLFKVMGTKEPILLDPELKKLALSTFLLSLLFYATVNYFL
ncbi:1,4-dihydroxy-2-naphthoate octaprenyltransferase [Flavobacteriaceae bacterium GF1]